MYGNPAEAIVLLKDYTKALEYAEQTQVYTEKLRIPEDAKVKELKKQLNSELGN